MKWRRVCVSMATTLGCCALLLGIIGFTTLMLSGAGLLSALGRSGGWLIGGILILYMSSTYGKS